MAAMPASAKAALRQQGLERRRALAPEVVSAAARAIAARLLDLDEFAQARLVHTYVSSKDNEVDTLALIRESAARGKRVGIPVAGAGGRLRHALIKGLEELAPTPWGLLEPRPGKAEWIDDLDEIDLVVVPGICFDRRGHRIGYGRGFYDRFLAQIGAPTIGLSYECLLLQQVPFEEHDVPVHMVITEKNLYRGERT